MIGALIRRYGRRQIASAYIYTLKHERRRRRCRHVTISQRRADGTFRLSVGDDDASEFSRDKPVMTDHFSRRQFTYHQYHVGLSRAMIREA